jgi:hypothetical protein
MRGSSDILLKSKIFLIASLLFSHRMKLRETLPYIHITVPYRIRQSFQPFQFSYILLKKDEGSHEYSSI